MKAIFRKMGMNKTIGKDELNHRFRGVINKDNEKIFIEFHLIEV